MASAGNGDISTVYLPMDASVLDIICDPLQDVHEKPEKKTTLSTRGQPRRDPSTTLCSRRSLGLHIMRALRDSDSGEDDHCEEYKDEDPDSDLASLLLVNNHSHARNLTRQMRDHIVMIDEGTTESTDVDERVELSVVESIDACIKVEGEEEMDVEIKQEDFGAQHADHMPDTSYNWSANFSEFTGQKETYLKDPGPQFSSQDPLKIFLHIWDETIVKLIVRQTNEYAWRYVAQLSDPDFKIGMPEHLCNWREVTVGEVYRLLSVMIYMSTCPRTTLTEYWKKWRMEMPNFRRIMSRNRYYQLCRFLHFVDNDADTSSLSTYQRKIHKISPILQHCNDKFSSMYVPSQHLSLDESLLLWKGRLSWKQRIPSKAARVGIKTFELCEATTGYLLRCILYGGEGSSMVQGPIHGFSNPTAKVVLKLMEGYLNEGHVLVMDNWYNQIQLTRYLKQHRTDVIGTMNRRRHNVPEAIRNMSPDVPRGTVVARHCGDISLTAWKDVRLVTVMSTYHSNEMVAGRRAGQAVRKPAAILEYNAYMGGVDLKDQKLSMFLFERKRGSKWYMKVFRRLVNTSLLNAYVIYLRNPCFKVMTHRQFRNCVAERLLENFFEVSLKRELVSAPPIDMRLNTKVSHFPGHTEPGEGRNKYKSRRCVRCLAAKRRKQVNSICRRCNVPLCLDQCWEDYHTLQNL